VNNTANENESCLGRGYVQVYTGNGKGKTTAALGLAMRAAGRGLKTYIGQFMKGQRYGELDAVERLGPLIRIEQYGRDTFVHVQNPPKKDDMRMAESALARARDAMCSGEYDIVIFDEIITSHFFHLVSLDAMLDVVSSKPDGVEVIFTGRYAPKKLIDAADLVTEMREVKHYLSGGITARDGIER
jgi:cob(I)alamin adenosyltransferase